MIQRYLRASSLLGRVLAAALTAPSAYSQILCPPMPDAVTTVNRDVRSSIELAAGSVAKVKAAEIAIRTDVAAKSLFDKYPNADKLLVVQMLASTYCSILTRSIDIPAREREQLWSKFQERVLIYAIPAPTANPTDNAIAEFRATTQPLYFLSGSTDLIPESKNRLKVYAERLKQLNFQSIVLEGHSSPVNLEINMNISQKRAETVGNYLIHLGIDPAKIKTVGMGARDPIQPGSNNYNNRVELRLLP